MDNIKHLIVEYIWVAFVFSAIWFVVAVFIKPPKEDQNGEA